jgi:nucleoside-diphosphate-sugar epimerase
MTDDSFEISQRLPHAPAAKRRVVLTGATGYIASQLLPVFRERYDLVALDVRAAEGVTQVNLLEDADEKLRPHFVGADAVVHLSYYRPAGTGVSGSGKSYLDERPNVDMAERVYRLSLDTGVRRVVVASSNHAADWYEPLIHSGKVDVIGPDAVPRSDNYYGWAKIAYEALGFIYASGAFGRKLEVVQVRIGAPREIEAVGPPSAYKRNLGAYISPRDMQQLFVKSLETERIEDKWGVPFQVFYGVSNNTRAFWSIANARRMIGYDPEDDSELRFAADIVRTLATAPGRVGGIP